MSPPQAEDIRATKKPRLEEPFSASTDEAAAEISSQATAGILPAAAADDDDDDDDDAHQADADPLKGARATGPWAPEEDAKLTSAVTKSFKKKWGKEYKTDYAAVAALVPSRTAQQCRDRWRHFLDPSIDKSNRRMGRWTKDEDSKLKDAVKTHGGKNWDAIAELILGRGENQCCKRWHRVLDPNINQASYMGSRRRQQASGCGTNAWWQEMGCNCRTGSGSNEATVLGQME
jgi:hypothetical protein